MNLVTLGVFNPKATTGDNQGLLYTGDWGPYFFDGKESSLKANDCFVQLRGAIWRWRLET